MNFVIQGFSWWYNVFLLESSFIGIFSLHVCVCVCFVSVCFVSVLIDFHFLQPFLCSFLSEVAID